MTGNTAVVDGGGGIFSVGGSVTFAVGSLVCDNSEPQCVGISPPDGVCGACARTGEVQLVPDVEAFPGHIACSSSTRSEIVLPVRDGAGRLLSVLDIDSDRPAAHP